MQAACFTFFFHFCFLLACCSMIDQSIIQNTLAPQISQREDKNNRFEKNQRMRSNYLGTIQEAIEVRESNLWSKMFNVDLITKDVNLAFEQDYFYVSKCQQLTFKEFSQSAINI